MNDMTRSYQQGIRDSRSIAAKGYFTRYRGRCGLCGEEWSGGSHIFDLDQPVTNPVTKRQSKRACYQCGRKHFEDEALSKFLTTA